MEMMVKELHATQFGPMNAKRQRQTMENVIARNEATVTKVEEIHRLEGTKDIRNSTVDQCSDVEHIWQSGEVDIVKVGGGDKNKVWHLLV